MRVAKLVEKNKIEIFEEKDIEITAANQVLVRVKAVGICGTDIHIFQGERADVQYPLVMGHELSGTVEKIGDAVSRVAVGDNVILDPVNSCGVCKLCKSGHPNVCSQVSCFGVQINGGFQDYIVVDESKLYPIPNNITYEVAALGEPFSIAANILERTGLSSEDSVVILGAGTIGLAVLQAAKGIGAKVLVCDIAEKKLDMAKEFHADAVVNSKTENLSEAVSKLFPQGADVIIDAVGIASLFEQSIELAAPTGRIAVIGFDNRAASIPPVKITKKELTIVGSRMNGQKFDSVVEWLEKGVITDKMISKTYPFEKIQDAFEYAVANNEECIKVMIALQEEV